MADLRTNVNQANSDFRSIKNAIVNSGVEIADGTPTSEYGSKVNKVYEAGLNSFREKYQYENRTEYQFAFAGKGWTNDTFKPIRDIKPIGSAYGLFWQSDIQGDLVEILDNLGIELDVSQATQHHYMFSNCQLTRVGVIDTTSVNTLPYMFSSCSTIETIDCLKIRENGSSTFNNVFNSCTNLKNLKIEGLLATNGLNLQWSDKLSGASIVSIIECLHNTKTDVSITLSQTAVGGMTFPITSTQTGTTYNSWNELIATKSNWTISLV